MLGFPQPAFMPCPECGASVASAELDEHVCERERWLDYQLHEHREQIARFESDVDAYLASAEGQFELWYARRKRSNSRPAHEDGADAANPDAS
jgi:hypothetical protein